MKQKHSPLSNYLAPPPAKPPATKWFNLGLFNPAFACPEFFIVI
jgi:hypothetical protein